MSFFHLRAMPGIAWPGLPTAELSQVWGAYLSLEQSQWLPPDEIEAGQLTQLRALLTHCAEHSPFYQQRLRDAGVRPNDIRTMAEFRRLPPLERQTYQERLEDIRARALPPGVQETGEGSSSGSRGVPIRVLQTNYVNLWWLAFYLRDLRWSGLDPRGNLAAIRTLLKPGENRPEVFEGISQSFWNRTTQALIDEGSSHGLDVHTDPHRQLAWLRRIAPDYLISYPSNLELLGSLLAEEGKPLPGLRVIQSLSEELTPEVRTHVERCFGVPVKNSYTCTEAGYVASPCPDGPGLHVHAENVLLEVVDDAGNPCKPGETGRVLLTTLHNHRAPFVRYDIHDRATFGPLCPCGRGLPLLTAVEGKRRPLLWLPDGRRKASDMLVMMLRKAGGNHQHQVIQRARDHVIVRVVPARDWGPGNEQAVREACAAYFESPLRVDVELYPRIELSPSGKLAGVIVECQ